MHTHFAIGRSVAGQGLGGQLLIAAVLPAAGAGILLIIAAKNERAAEWYDPSASNAN